uniref:Uncharacterized protein n=1 Tax=Arundo donax TaxID=35708 RepID=A0A0A9ENU7_ARUDO
MGVPDDPSVQMQRPFTTMCPWVLHTSPPSGMVRGDQKKAGSTSPSPLPCVWLRPGREPKRPSAFPML